MSAQSRQALGAFFCGIGTLLLFECAGVLLFLNSFTPATEQAPLRPTASFVLTELKTPFQDMQGVLYSADAFKNKVIVLNIWATWCPPCRKEMPSLQRLWARYQKNSDVGVYCISQEALESVRKAPLVQELNMPVYCFAEELPKKFAPNALPTTYIFDRQGHMIFQHIGLAQWDAPQIIALIEELL